MFKSIGIDFKIKHVELNGLKFKLQVWDTAGQERFRTITAAYYRACKGIILACDMSRHDGLASLEYWIKNIKDNAPPNAVIILLGTKNDLETQIPLDVMKKNANEKEISFVSTSAKTGNGVNEAFMRLLKEVIILSNDDFGVRKENQPLVQPQPIDGGKNNSKTCC